MTKAEIISGLEAQYGELTLWLTQQPYDLFEVNIEGKWSPGQHADHLVKSTAPINQAMRMPKLGLRTMFGKNNREERNYDQVVDKYTQAIQNGGKAMGQFVPKAIENKQKSELIEKLNKEVSKLTSIINKWDDKDLSTYLLPHPLIGKMTLNEILYFTIFHTEYHIKILKRDYGDN